MDRGVNVGADCAVSATVRARRIEREAFWEGWRASVSTTPAILVWGMVSGMAMVKSGLTVWQALGMTLIVYAGSAQLAVLPLLEAHTALIIIFLTGLLINLRFVIFSAVMAPHFAHLPWYKRIWYGYFNGDISMAFFPQRFPAHTVHEAAGKIGYFSAICYPSWMAWQMGAITGIFLAGQIPESWGIGFVGTLALMALMIPMINNLAALVGVIVSAVAAMVAIDLPYRLGVLLAVVLGIVVAMAVDNIIDKKNK